MLQNSPFAVGVQCLALVARMQQTPVEANALLREFTPQSDDLNDIYLVKAAKSLGFKARFLPKIIDDSGRRRALEAPGT